MMLEQRMIGCGMGCLFMAAVMAFGALVTFLVWNHVICLIPSVPHIDYLQAVGVNIILGLISRLLKSIGGK